jgi:hypothetical protein
VMSKVRALRLLERCNRDGNELVEEMG